MRSLRSAGPAPATPKSKSKGSGETAPPKRKAKTFKNGKDADAFITRGDLTTHIDDLKRALLGALNEKKKPPQPPVAPDDEGSGDGSSGPESSNEDELPRKTSNSQEALQVLKGLDDEASAARSAAKAALRRAEETMEIAVEY